MAAPRSVGLAPRAVSLVPNRRLSDQRLQSLGLANAIRSAFTTFDMNALIFHVLATDRLDPSCQFFTGGLLLAGLQGPSALTSQKCFAIQVFLV